jgi:hypothetical protein
MLRYLFLCITLPASLSASAAFTEGLPQSISSFQGHFSLNGPDTEENKSLRAFLEKHDGQVVFLELEIDASVSVESQVQTMNACRLDVMAADFDGGDLLNRDLGFPEAMGDGRSACWSWLTIESDRKMLPRNGASTGIVWYNLDGFFFVRNEVHGNNSPSFFLREIEADAATWAAVSQEN